MPINWSDLWLRIRAAILPGRVEQELDEEVSFHLEMQFRKNLQAGMPESQARQQARLRFGREGAVKEDCRDKRRIRPIETLRQDIRYALRGMRRTPVFAITVILTIGLGLGVNTALFSVFNAYALRPLAVTDPQSVYHLQWLNRSGERHGFTWPQYQRVVKENPAFSEVHAVRGLPVRVDGRQWFAELVTGNYFQMLGVTAQLGRVLTPGDSAVPGQRMVIVLNASTWHAKFASNPNIVGKKILVRGFPFEVVGVARDGFSGLGDLPRDAWIPLSMNSLLVEGPDLFGPKSPEVLSVIGRLNPGMTEKHARALLTVWAHRITSEEGPAESRAASAVLESRATSIHLGPDAFGALIPIFAAFALVLLIACANVANMMLARGIARQREMGIRLSLGAARSRLIRQLLTESIVLALPGAIIGFLASEFVINGAIALLFATLPPEFSEFIRVAPLDPDWRVLAFMISAAALSGIVFGLAPALQATRPNLVQAARGDFAHELRPQRLRNALVVFQIAVSTLLLITSGELLRGADRARSLDTHLRTPDVIWIELLERNRPAVLAQLMRQPLVQSIAAARQVPLEAGLPSAWVSASVRNMVNTSYNFVSAEYFDVLGIPIARGRNFTRDECLTEAPVTVMSETAARRLWPNQEAIGRTIHLAPDDRSHLANRSPLRYSEVQVIGVARDVNTEFSDKPETRTLVYFPSNSQTPGTALMMRVKGDPETARRLIDRNLWESVPGGVDKIHKMTELVAAHVYPFRVATWVSAALGLLALMLTVSGIYGVVSYLVEQRTHENGIRMALGAGGGRMVSLLLSQSIRLALGGIIIGDVISVGLSRILASSITAFRAVDPPAHLAGIGIVLAACLVASLIPSLRTARLDPLATLRHD